ncbi:MAG: competence/damage-inducible protein A [Acidobacteria bacterium]|nr:competence/damage-inducible protein A [Acidobacteriota bacterium]
MSSVRNAEIIAIGSELLTPLRSDTNSLHITRRLNEVGIEVRRKTVVGDALDDLTDAVAGAMARADLVITMGGLGPTEDDRTREAVGRATGRSFVRSEEWVDSMKDRFARAGRSLGENNLRQADILEGAELLTNPKGTAPGQWLPGRCSILMLPGPPRELKPLFDGEGMARIAPLAAGTGRVLTRILRITGMTESHADSLVGPIYRDLVNPSVTILSSPGSIELHLRAVGEGVRTAEELIAGVEAQFREKLGERVYGTDDESLETVVARMLLAAKQTIATAESCTGGLLAGRLTEIPGSSNYFLRGFVCYTNESKVDELGVPAELIAAHGAVSADVAGSMGAGARRIAAADLGVSITGIAGPTGGSAEKPVGLVYISVADRAGVVTTENRFPGERGVVRFQATQRALDMIRMRLMEGSG